MSQTAKNKKVYFLLYEGVEILDVSGPAEVLSLANRSSGDNHYEIHYVGQSSTGRLVSSAGLPLCVETLPEPGTPMDYLFVPGADLATLERARADRVLMHWLKAAVERARVVASVCSGAFLLGQLGYLDHRRATTHWMGTRQLQSEFPLINVEEDNLYTQDGRFWTSAGVLTGVDMTLAIVRGDLGASKALEIARILVVHLFRDGGQSQFSAAIDLQTRAREGNVISLIGWLDGQLHRRIDVEQMADYLNISVRTLHRRCQLALEMTPAQILSELRLQRSRNLLHDLNLPLKVIAFKCGFANAAAYSKAFKQRFGVAPKPYRERFNLSL